MDHVWGAAADVRACMECMLQHAGSPAGIVKDTEEQDASDFEDEDPQQSNRRLQQLSAALIKAQHCPALASLPVEQLRQLMAQLMKYSAAAQSTLLGLGEEVGTSVRLQHQNAARTAAFRGQ